MTTFEVYNDWVVVALHATTYRGEKEIFQKVHARHPEVEDGALRNAVRIALPDLKYRKLAKEPKEPGPVSLCRLTPLGIKRKAELMARRP